MHKDYTQTSSESIETRSTHKSLARRSQQERLIALARKVIRGESTNPKGHLEIVLSRIRPEPTPLPEIQRNRTDLGFISDPQARIFYLREKFGFCIQNRIDRSVTPALSFYWLELDATGTGPKMKPVGYAPEKTALREEPLQTVKPEAIQALLPTEGPTIWRDPEMGSR